MNLLTEISQNKNIIKPVIYGISGTSLTEEEKVFFGKNSCIGFILFSRNIVDKQQVKALTKSLRELMNGEVLILIDQEGGRVARLQPPIWKEYKTGEYFSDLYKENKNQALEEIFTNFQNIANDLVEVGINVNCAPVLDILSEKTHNVIGNRAYGENPQQVSILGQKVCDALLSKNIYPVIKHIPGHGLGACDSHLELPTVNENISYLRNNDFLPFIALKEQKFAMTAHILYSAIDNNFCVTESKIAIDLIRNEIGFKNILMSDDLSMKALKGSFADKTTNSLKAGCDLILHCNGNMEEMLEINSSLPEINDKFWQRFIS